MEDINAESTAPVSAWLRLRASAVHLYTASGAVLTLLILVAAYSGHTVAALWLILATLVIDSTDGLLARRYRVKELVPSFDGGLLDNIVDYMTYVFAPILLLWSAGYLPSGRSAWPWRPSPSSRRATSSAGWTPRPGTTPRQTISSWASRATGT